MRFSPFLLAGLVLAQPAFTLTASAQSTDEVPAPAHGKPLTLDQFLSRQTARIMAADTDGDGRVSKAEMMAAASGGKGGEARGNPERRFDRMDTNHDGYLDKDEIRAALTQRFQRMDRNGDGVLTPDERVGQRGGGRANQGGGAMPAPAQQP
ncbi:EF-hand domain-containing protein [Novosphingobium rosa]|uniref:EF-hand domain-containing protein n=1 Tax=Novosphingobium rosa TaxID=76978 RepID=UPI0008371FE1|nr:EF-hand domain-containing protein [Novosphingobium rosa]